MSGRARARPRPSAQTSRPITARRLVFLGTPEVAARTLVALVDAGHEVVLAVTRPDRRRTRSGEPSPSPVKLVAESFGIPVTSGVGDVVGSGAELGVVVAYGRLIPAEVFTAVPMVNVHFSLLPRWRGAAPVERAILAGDGATGVCLMQIEEGLDTGPVFACAAVAIGPTETAEELRSRLGALGSELLLDRLARPEGLGTPTPQEPGATTAEKINPEELRLDFSRSAVELGRVVRVGRAWTTYRGRRLLVRRATPHPEVELSSPPGTLVGSYVATGAGALELFEVQAEGRAAMSFDSWAAGARLDDGASLGS